MILNRVLFIQMKCLDHDLAIDIQGNLSSAHYAFLGGAVVEDLGINRK